MIYHWVHTADPVGFIMISPVIWSRDLLCLASGFGCVPGTLVLRGVGHHYLRKTEPLHSVVPRCFVDTCCEWFTTMAFRWTTLQSRQWSWSLNGLPVALGICPDYWMWCLRNGFQSAGIYSCTCIAVNPNTQGVCVCVCLCVCVSVIPSQQWRFTVLDGGMMITLLSFPRKRSNFQQTSTAFEENLRSLMIPKELSAIRW